LNELHADKLRLMTFRTSSMKKSFSTILKQTFFWFKRVLDRGPEHRESKMTVL
jgi:hypothetical protein